LSFTLGRGMGLAACWTAAVAFQVIRLALNSARLLRARSVLSREDPLPDALADVEAQLLEEGSGELDCTAENAAAT
jgi:hypothetical protein